MKAVVNNEKAADKYPAAFKPSGFRVDVAEEENKVGCAVLFFKDETTRFHFLQTVNNEKATHAREIKLDDVEDYTGGAYLVIKYVGDLLFPVSQGTPETVE